MTAPKRKVIDCYRGTGTNNLYTDLQAQLAEAIDAEKAKPFRFVSVGTKAGQPSLLVCYFHHEIPVYCDVFESAESQEEVVKRILERLKEEAAQSLASFVLNAPIRCETCTHKGADDRCHHLYGALWRTVVGLSEPMGCIHHQDYLELSQEPA